MSAMDADAHYSRAWISKLSDAQSAYTRGVSAGQERAGVIAGASAIGQPWHAHETTDGLVYVPREWSLT